jgi:hypothetical protein
MTHFKLHLAIKKHDMASGPVKAVQPGILIQPDKAAVRECLPHFYRSAFDRDGTFWQDKHNPDSVQYSILKGMNGKYLNTIYATPVEL